MTDKSKPNTNSTPQSKAKPKPKAKNAKPSSNASSQAPSKAAQTKASQKEEVTLEQNAAVDNGANAAQAPVQQPVVVQQKASSGLSVFAILLSLLALAGAGFSLYDNQVRGSKDEASLAVGVADIGGHVNRLGDSIERLQVAQDNVVSKEVLDAKISDVANKTDIKVREIEQSQRQAISRVEQSQQQVSGLVSKLNEDLSKGTSDYTVAEVSQLLKLANHSVNFSKDPNAAINALKLADAQLKELADPRYATTRQAINEEIGSLEAVTTIDVESITGRLRALEKVVPSLPLENDTPTLGDIEVAQAEEGDTSIKAEVKNIWADLVALLKPQRVDEAPKPLLAPEQRFFLDQNIQLQFAKAQLSVLQNRGTEYQASLESAETLLRDYYDLRSDEVTSFLNNVSELKSTQLVNELPNVSKSFDLLQKARGGR